MIREFTSATARLGSWTLIISLGLALWSCSNAGSEADYPRALRSVQDAVATDFQAQLDSTGQIVPDKTLEAVAPKADAMIKAGCDAIAKQKSAMKKEIDVPGLPQLDDFPNVQLARTIGRFPKQIYVTKVQWPEEWLLTPGAQPDYTAPLSAVDGEFFKRFLKPEFLGPDGSVIFPMPGAAQYPNFQGLLDNSKETLANRISYQTSPVERGIEKCLPSD
jgi:hypothetical protein